MLVCLLVLPLVHPSLNILGMPSIVFYNILHEVGGEYLKKSDMSAFLKKNLNLGIKGENVSKMRVFQHFLRNQSLIISNCLHHGRRQ